MAHHTESSGYGRRNKSGGRAQRDEHSQYGEQRGGDYGDSAGSGGAGRYGRAYDENDDIARQGYGQSGGYGQSTYGGQSSGPSSYGQTGYPGGAGGAAGSRRQASRYEKPQQPRRVQKRLI